MGMKFTEVVGNPAVLCYSGSPELRTVLTELVAQHSVTPAQEQQESVEALLAQNPHCGECLMNGALVLSLVSPLPSWSGSWLGMAVFSSGAELPEIPGKTVSLLYVLVSSPERGREHVRSLARLVRVFTERPFLATLRATRSPEEAARAFRSHDLNHL